MKLLDRLRPAPKNADGFCRCAEPYLLPDDPDDEWCWRCRRPLPDENDDVKPEADRDAR